MSAAPKVLVVDDEPSMRRYLRTLLEVDSFQVDTADNGDQALVQLESGKRPDLVLLDLLMPGRDGLETLEELRRLYPELPVIMLSCVSDTAKVVQAMRLGAQDYLTKPFQKQELDAAFKRTLPGIVAGAALEPAEIEVIDDETFFLAASPVMRQIRSQVALVAQVDVPVLLLGESGCGKEVVAKLIHKLSPRADRTFMKVNCAALPGELLESELFGYDKGAFTGAHAAKPGKFEQCDKGTLLLDEIGEMPTALQAKLLHVLQDGSFSRLGGRSSVKVDVRVLAATNINVQKNIHEKTLREDLYYRLNTFPIEVPPLRDRKEEIPHLLRHFMSRMAESYGREPLPISPALIDACEASQWPGNVRELANFVKRYVILGDERLAIAELHASSRAVGKPAAQAAAAPRGDLKSLVRGLKGEAEMDAINGALLQTQWNRKDAARLLNMSYKALLTKIRLYGLKPPSTLLRSRID